MGMVICGAIGQRHNWANTGGRHQTPAHIIVANHGPQAAVQHADLLAKHPLDDEGRFDQHGGVFCLVGK
jgi:hypothetical protein